MQYFKPAFPGLWEGRDIKEIKNLPHTEWFRASDNCDHFRVRRENDDEVGFEHVYRIFDGLIIRVLDLQIRRDSWVKAYVPGGYVICFFGMDGDVVLIGEAGEELKHIKGTCGTAYHKENEVIEDFAQANTKYTLVQVLIQKQRLETDFLSGISLPKALRYIYEKDKEKTFDSIPIDVDIFRAFRGIAGADNTGKLRDSYLEAKAKELICLLIRALHRYDKDSPNKPLEPELLEHARELLLTDLSAPPSLKDLARHLGMSKSSLSERFKQTYGLSMRDYQLKARMERARILLIQSNLDVNQIGWQIGYKHVCNFVTAFKRFYGCTPNVFRQEQLNRKSSCSPLDPV